MSYSNRTVEIHYINDNRPGEGVGACWTVVYVGHEGEFSTQEAAVQCAKWAKKEYGAVLIRDFTPTGNRVVAFGFGLRLPSTFNAPKTSK